MILRDRVFGIDLDGLRCGVGGFFILLRIGQSSREIIQGTDVLRSKLESAAISRLPLPFVYSPPVRRRNCRE